MATKIISHSWKLKLPNSFLVDHSFSDNKERDQTYDGPDKIYLQIGANGKELYGPLTEDDIADGRPKPADVVQWYEVDCARSNLHTLICQLRGPVVNEKDLISALEDDDIAGAGLDVFDVEPLPQDHKLRFLPNALLLPHIGFVTEENYSIFYNQMVENLVSCISGTPKRLIK